YHSSRRLALRMVILGLCAALLVQQCLHTPPASDLKSYLDNRKQMGGVLSPLLFVLCVNTLDSNLPISIHPVKCADDLTLIELFPGNLPCQQTQAAVNAVAEWGKTNCLYVNEKKTKDMLISRLDVLPNPLKRPWRRLIVEKLTFNYLATALVDIPAVSIPIARSLKT
uniref:Reverse transcriptase domain-containing protein n=1 Tax=Hucho hucho TaxID=62062 RepID=A0A4W5PTY3_9TELE